MEKKMSSREYTEAVAEGPAEMTHSILFGLPEAVKRLLGEQAAAALMLRALSEGAQRGFKVLIERLGANNMAIADALAVLTREFPAPHPFRVFESIEHEEDEVRLVCIRDKCGDRSPAKMAVIVGIIEGVLRALGIEARAVTSNAGRHAAYKRIKEDFLYTPLPMKTTIQS